MTSVNTESTVSAPKVDDSGEVQLSVVMPCLNEVDTLEVCIKKAEEGIRVANISGEIVIADNGSTDGSPELARSLGARVVHVSAKGYGNALMGGIEAAKGRFIIMGDADDSYDFREIPRFVGKLREGYALVQGCRLPSGRRDGHARRNAVPAPMVGKSHVFHHGPLLVPSAGP